MDHLTNVRIICAHFGVILKQIKKESPCISMDNTERNRIYFQQEVQVWKTAVMQLLYVGMTATSFHIPANPSNSKKRKNFVDLGQ